MARQTSTTLAVQKPFLLVKWPIQLISASPKQDNSQEFNIVSRGSPIVAQPESLPRPIRRDSLFTSQSVQRTTPLRRPREDDEGYGSWPGPVSKRIRTSESLPSEATQRTTNQDPRIDYWTRNGCWPKEEKMNPPRYLAKGILTRRKSTRNLWASATSECTPTKRPNQAETVKYTHPLYEDQLGECGSFMRPHEGGVTTTSEEICKSLLDKERCTPKETVFSDQLFHRTLALLKGATEFRVFRDIGHLIVPPAEILFIQGDKHLEIVRETNNGIWTNTLPICGPRPQPDYGLGFKREAFTPAQRKKLQPLVGDVLKDDSYLAATYNVYMPFLTCEAKCGAGDLEVADRQNAHSQTIAVRALITLFQQVGQENELHREVLGFSISYNEASVKIYGHYAFIDGADITYYRHTITEYMINKSTRWIAYKFVRNLYDEWLPSHYKRICSAIDMLSDDPKNDVSTASTLQDQESHSSHSVVPQPHEVDGDQ